MNGASLDLFKRLNEEMHSQDSKHKRSFRLVNTELDQPELVLRVRQNMVQFEVMDQTCRDNGLTRMPFKVNDVSINGPYLLSILRSAADFYWQLRHSSNKKGSLAGKVLLECLELERSGSLLDDLTHPHIPKTGGKNLIESNTITIEDARGDELDSRRYGYRITNKSDYAFCVALFYFDMSDLSIGNG
ncbi:hypothetical protein DXG01_007593 [Tephrocybe rancida]|nr:hypothetical protein DXG01_007593 [Tephrocybe rancida]